MQGRDRPIYQQIADDLRQSIQKGIYQPGSRIPTEAQLSQRFGVNRHTLRRAIALLQMEGLVRSDQGRGTFVSSHPIRYPIGKRMRYGQVLASQGRKLTSQRLRLTETSADSPLAEALEIPIGERVAVLERLGIADEEPISVSTQHFPISRFPDIMERLPYGIQSISTFFREHYGCDHLRRRTVVSARTIKPQDAFHLELSLNAAVLLVESINVDQRGRVIEYGVTRFRGDRMELIVENELSEEMESAPRR